MFFWSLVVKTQTIKQFKWYKTRIWFHIRSGSKKIVHTKVWSYDPIFLSHFSAEVHCFQIKSIQDISLVIFVYNILENNCFEQFRATKLLS